MKKFLQKIKHTVFFSYLHLKHTYRLISNKPIIHVIGDSHSLFFQQELFTIHHIGPSTAFNLASDTSSTQGGKKIKKLLQNIGVNQKAIVLFIFGEIDCRIHINKSSKKLHISLEKAVNNTVVSYGHFLKDMKQTYPQITFLILNVLPSGEEKNIYGVKHYPSRSLHLEIVRSFNKKLKQFCQRNNLIFLSVFDELLDKEDKRITDYIYDSGHYNKRVLPLIIRELKQKGIV